MEVLNIGMEERKGWAEMEWKKNQKFYFGCIVFVMPTLHSTGDIWNIVGYKMMELKQTNKKEYRIKKEGRK